MVTDSQNGTVLKAEEAKKHILDLSAKAEKLEVQNGKRCWSQGIQHEAEKI